MNTAAPIDRKELLLKLIENDIYSNQLINGLSEILHLEASEYMSRLSDLVFRLLGYDPQNVPDTISDTYFEMLHDLSLKTLGTGWQKIPESAEMIYTEMLTLHV